MLTCPRIAAGATMALFSLFAAPDGVAGGIVRFENTFGPCSPTDFIPGPGNPVVQGVSITSADFQTLNIGAAFTALESDGLFFFAYGAGATFTFPETTTKVRFKATQTVNQVAFPTFAIFANGNQVGTFYSDIFHVTDVEVDLGAPTNQITIQYVTGVSSAFLMDDLTYGDVGVPDCDSYWPMTPTADPSLVDDVIGANDGALLNGAAYFPGVFGSAVQLDGLDDYCEMPDSDSLDVGPSVAGTTDGDFSLAMWFQASFAPGSRPVLDKRQEGSGPVTGYHIFTFSGKIGLQLADGTPTNWFPSNFIADGLWHHVVVTIDRDQHDGIKFYIDGAFAGPTFDPTGHPGSLANAFPLRFGHRSDADGYFSGSLDEVLFCRRVLTPSEAALLFGGSKPNGAWTKLGSAKTGTLGLPNLEGSGDLSVNSLSGLYLTNAKQNAFALLAISTTETPTPFLGGVLRPFPIALLINAFPSTTATGTYDFPFIVPVGLPSQSPLYFQWIIQDSLAANGVALSNALEGWIP